VPTGDLLITGAVLEEQGQPPVVLHFALPLSSPRVKVMDNWRTLGMRGTGSHDIEIDGHIVPEAAVSLKRRSGEWHPLFQIITTIAFPLVYAAYLGVAERARDIALKVARGKPDRHTIQIAGRLETEIMAARLAHGHMLATVRLNAPSAQTVNDIMTARQLVGRHTIAAVEQAMELAGGSGFYRAVGLERRFRDIQGARYHVMRTAQQQEYAGSMALHLPVDKVY
jgi:alkylation response protein AidB-like acyl-CoA dehydrogenase